MFIKCLYGFFSFFGLGVRGIDEYIVVFVFKKYIGWGVGRDRCVNRLLKCNVVRVLGDL